MELKKMGKISPVSSKYIINASIEIEGVVDRPDVIGAIFGQTEGLLGSDLELRELQRSGRIGRIEVNVEIRNGKSQGVIIIPSSLDKAETCIVAAALEIIQRIGPCNAKVKINNIEDVRINKRNFVVDRAKGLLKNLMDNVMPDSQEIAEEVAYSVRVMEITEYGKERLPSGPAIDDSDDIIIVEGRADVLALLKQGFKNVIALNGTSIPKTVVDLSKQKEVTIFVDGDRGGDLILKDILNIAEVDFVTKAPDGKEVEELAKKEIHKALRSKITAEQAKLELASVDTSNIVRKPMINKKPAQNFVRPPIANKRDVNNFAQKKYFSQKNSIQMSVDEKKKFGNMLESLLGTRGAIVLDGKLSILGKVPSTELASTLKSLNTGVYAVVLDGVVDKSLVDTAEKTSIKHIIAMDSKVKKEDSRLNIITASEL
jgi:DNA primase